jgi:hypothetical protein
MSERSLPVLLVVVALVLTLVALFPRREVRHPAVALLRVLVPSWRFFDDIQTVPALLVRTATRDGEFGTWQALLPPAVRHWSFPVFNPEGNLRLAEHSLLERLLMDVSEWDERRGEAVDALVSYQLVLNLVRAETRCVMEQGAERLQFKLVERDAVTGALGSDLLVSREHSPA